MVGSASNDRSNIRWKWGQARLGFAGNLFERFSGGFGEEKDGKSRQRRCGEEDRYGRSVSVEMIVEAAFEQQAQSASERTACIAKTRHGRAIGGGKYLRRKTGE